MSRERVRKRVLRLQNALKQDPNNQSLKDELKRLQGGKKQSRPVGASVKVKSRG